MNGGPHRAKVLVVDTETREVFRGSQLIELTDTEFRLLRFFMSNPRRVLTRDQILDHVWNYEGEPSEGGPPEGERPEGMPEGMEGLRAAMSKCGIDMPDPPGGDGPPDAESAS